MAGVTILSGTAAMVEVPIGDPAVLRAIFGIASVMSLGALALLFVLLRARARLLRLRE